MLAMDENQDFEDLSMALNDMSSAEEESGADEESSDDEIEEVPKVEVVSAKSKSKKRKRDTVNTKEIELDHILFGNKEGLITNLRGFLTDDIDQEVEAKQAKSAW